MQLTVKETAELLKKSQQFVRIGLQRGILPFGYAIQLNGNKYTYHISKNKVYEYLGIDGKEQLNDGAGTVREIC